MELDTKLSYHNDTDNHFSYKGCIDKGHNKDNIVPNEEVVSSETRNYFSSCSSEMCNNNTSGTTPHATPPTATTPEDIKPTNGGPDPEPPNLQCYLCRTDCEEGPWQEVNCTREHVENSHERLSYYLNTTSKPSDEITGYECLSISSEIGKKN